MNLQFTKMQGLGNDFVVIDAISQTVKLSLDQIKHIADRKLGIGCDQLLLLEQPTEQVKASSKSIKKVDFRYRIFNADGSEVEQCGNGARCFMRFIKEKGLIEQDERVEVCVETLSGLLILKDLGDNQFSVNMGVPEFEPNKIPFISESKALLYSLELDQQHVEIGAVAVGNPHAVMQVDDIDNTDVNGLGVLIESHMRFPNRVNAGFMQIVDKGTIRLRVYERGVGETQACGSGACAAMAVAFLRGLVAQSITVETLGGALIIDWQGPGHPIWMTGSAETVFQGTIAL